MKKSVLFCILVIGLFSYTTIAVGPMLTAEDKLQLKDFEVAGIRMFEPMENMIKRFGKSQSIKSFYEDKYRSYIYSDLDIGCFTPGDDDNYIVDSVSVKTKGYKTFRGISVGDDVSRVFNLYGKGKWVDTNTLDYQTWLKGEDEFDETPYGIYFIIKNKRVVNFRVYIPID